MSIFKSDIMRQGCMKGPWKSGLLLGLYTSLDRRCKLTFLSCILVSFKKSFNVLVNGSISSVLRNMI